MTTNQAQDQAAPHGQTSDDAEIARSDDSTAPAEPAGQDTTESGEKQSHERMRRIGLKLFGPADSGPYGPPTEPPAPRPRDRWGHPLKEPKAE